MIATPTHTLTTTRTLDYTAVAPPLTMNNVKCDIDEYCCAHVEYPDKIVLWVHQWDYLVKEHAHLRVESKTVDHEIWGIPVEVREL